MVGQTTARYSIRVRDSALRTLGQLDAYRRLAATLRYNAVADWALELDADAPLAGALATRGNGIVVTREVLTIATGTTRFTHVLLSGPIRHWQRRKQGNTLLVAGKDDLAHLALRDAYPVTTAPYAPAVLALPGILRYYRLGETSGTFADSKSGIPASAAGGLTRGVVGTLLDEPAQRSVQTNGVDALASASATGIPTGSASQWWGCWFRIVGLPAGGAFGMLLAVGTPGTSGAAWWLGIEASGAVTANLWGSSSAVTSGALNDGKAHCAVFVWDSGTTLLTLYIDGVAVGSVTPSLARAITAGGVYIGAGNTQYFSNAVLGEVMGGSGTLTAAQVANVFALGHSRFAASATDTRTGVAETVLRGYVAANCLSGTALADPLGNDRAVAGLTLGVDGGAGSVVTGTARFDPLVSKDGLGLLQQLAQAGGVGFRIVQSGTTLAWQVYVPQNRPAVVFSEALGTVADFDYSVTAPDLDTGGNAIIVGGGGQGTGRVLLERADATSLTAWGRAEGFRDARDTSDVPTLTQRGDVTLAESKEKTAFSAVLAPGDTMVYGLDFDLGDRVTVSVDGVSFSEIVREVQVSVDAQSGETITPVVGTANTRVVQDALATFAHQAQRLESRLGRIERAQ